MHRAGASAVYSILTEGPNGKLWDLYPRARSDAEVGGGDDRSLSLTGLTYIPPLLNRERKRVIGRYTFAVRSTLSLSALREFRK